MKMWLAAAALALSSWSSISLAQQPSTAAPDAAPATHGLSALDAMTFSCAKAALNAAAREAAKTPSQGTYQFAYFNIVNDSHHAAYEVHFKSNYAGEAELKYCVNVYCQQGWDPATKAEVTLLTTVRQRKGGAAHAMMCGSPQAPARRAR